MIMPRARISGWPPRSVRMISCPSNSGGSITPRFGTPIFRHHRSLSPAYRIHPWRFPLSSTIVWPPCSCILTTGVSGSADCCWRPRSAREPGLNSVFTGRMNEPGSFISVSASVFFPKAFALIREKRRNTCSGYQTGGNREKIGRPRIALLTKTACLAYSRLSCSAGVTQW